MHALCNHVDPVEHKSWYGCFPIPQAESFPLQRAASARASRPWTWPHLLIPPQARRWCNDLKLFGVYTDRLQQVERMNELLAGARTFLEDHPRLAKQLHFRISEKNDNDKARLTKFLSYEGPDDATTALLKQKYHPWMADGMLFWSHFMELKGKGSWLAALYKIYSCAQGNDS